MELDFGCEVEWQYTPDLNKRLKTGIFVNFGNGDLRNPLPINVLFYGNSSVKSIPKKEDVKILGKPITLSVVLRAIYEHRRQTPNWYFVTVDFTGFMQDSGNRNNVADWNLEKDNFNDQSEETKTFIGGLLGIKRV